MSAAPTDTANNYAPEPSGCTLDLTEPFVLGDWRIDPTLRTASRGDTIGKIDPRNMRVLQILVERHGQVVSQRELESLAWEGVVVTPDSLYQSIRQLRQALQDTKAPARYIETVPRRGYRILVAPMKVESAGNSIPPVENRIAAIPIKQFLLAVPRTLQTNQIVMTTLIVLVSAAIFYLSFASRPVSIANVPSPSTTDPKDAATVRTSDSRPARRERTPGASFKTLRALGSDSLHAGRPHDAIEYFQQALQRQISDAGENNEPALRIFAEISNAHLWLDDESAAYEYAAKALTIADQLGPTWSAERIWSVSVLTNVLVALGEYSDADSLITDAVDASKKHLGAYSSSLLNPTYSLALLRLAQGQLPESEQFARKTEAIAVHAEGQQSIHTANAKNLIAAILLQRNEFEQAEREARVVMDIASRHRSSGLHPYEVSAKHILAEALMGQGEFARAKIQLEEELEALQEARAVDWRIGRAASALGEVYLRTNRLSNAERYIKLAKDKLTRAKGYPIEREVRNLARRLEELDALRPKQVSALTN